MQHQRRRHPDQIQHIASVTNIDNQEAPAVAKFSSTPISATSINVHEISDVQEVPDESKVQVERSNTIARSG